MIRAIKKSPFAAGQTLVYDSVKHPNIYWQGLTILSDGSRGSDSFSGTVIKAGGNYKEGKRLETWNKRYFRPAS